jgi:hypothetical protein
MNGDRTAVRCGEPRCRTVLVVRGVTPYWWLYDVLALLWRLVGAAPRAGLIGRVAAAFVLFGIVPTVLFVLWLGQEGAPGLALDKIRWSTWLVVPWLPLSPILILVWEADCRALLARVADDPGTDWPADRIQRAARRVDRLYWPVVLAAILTCVGGYLWADEVRLDYTARGAWAAVAPLIVGFLSLSVGTGIWAAFKTLVVVRVALRPTLAWDPYLARPAGSVDALSSFAYRTGVLFSLGSVFVPGLLSLLPALSGPPRLLVYLLIGVLGLGGFAVFALSTRWLNDQALRQREAALAKFAPILRESEASVLPGSPVHADRRRELAEQLGIVAALVGVVTAAPALSAGVVRLQRMSATLLLPVGLSLLELLP